MNGRTNTFPDRDWDLEDEQGRVSTWQRVEIAVMMDIRRELKRLNSAIYCQNCLAIPHKLDRIIRNTNRIPMKKKARKR